MDLIVAPKPPMNPWLNRLVYGLVPGTCLICEERTRRQLDLCRGCETDLPWLRHHCLRCALPLASVDIVCGRCAVTPPPWDLCFAAFEYRSPMDRLIGEFKNNHRLLTGKILASLLATAMMRCRSAQRFPDLLVPVPLHDTRLRRRGYNQAAEIADVLADRCRLPMNALLCRKVRDTPAQKALDARARRDNIRGAYRLEQPVTDVNIGLVDDVITTGATAAELSRLFVDGGAASVQVIALARTPRPVLSS